MGDVRANDWCRGLDGMRPCHMVTTSTQLRSLEMVKTEYMPKEPAGLGSSQAQTWEVDGNLKELKNEVSPKQGANHTFSDPVHVLAGPSHVTIHQSPVSDCVGDPNALTSCCAVSGDLTRWLCSHFVVVPWNSRIVWPFRIGVPWGHGSFCKRSFSSMCYIIALKISRKALLDTHCAMLSLPINNVVNHVCTARGCAYDMRTGVGDCTPGRTGPCSGQAIM